MHRTPTFIASRICCVIAVMLLLIWALSCALYTQNDVSGNGAEVWAVISWAANWGWRFAILGALFAICDALNRPTSGG